MSELLICNARFIGDEQLYDIRIRHGKIIEIGQFSQMCKEEVKIIDATNQFLLPPFVESHIHLDTALTYGKPLVNHSGGLSEGISIWGQYQREYLDEEDVELRAKSVIESMIEYGVLYMRSMVDITAYSQAGLHALLKVKEEVKDYFDLQLIAFPQLGLIHGNGVERLKEAISLGVDGISCVPHLENTREEGIKSVQMCFQIAKSEGKALHIFCDETDDADSKFLEVVASLAIEHNLSEQVTVSHINALAYYNESYAQKVISLVKRANLHVVTAPLISSVVQGRLGEWPKSRGITRVKDLVEAGVNVACAHDDFLSPFYPLGTGSPLQAGYMFVHLAHMTGRDDFDKVLKMLTTNAARLLGLSNYGIDIGHPANLLIFPAKDAHDLLRRQPKPSYVIHNGRIVAQTIPEQTTLTL
ncbi:cytosine deaminase [Bacillus sp. TS-2]|nr:cytosine deaminase [Bacillus sp. TS-2]